MKNNKLFKLALIIALTITCICMLAACNSDEIQTEQTESVVVVLDYNDGSAPVEKTINPKNIGRLIPPMRTGYDFAYWALDREGTVKLGKLVENGATLYAQWTAKKYNVYFMLDEVTLIEKQSLPYGSTVTPPSDETIASKLEKGMRFLGWQTDLTDLVVTEETTIYARIGNTPYTVKFQDGDTVVKTIEGGDGDVIAPPPNPAEKDGYTFIGWKTANGKALESGATISANETYFATYSLIAPSVPVVTDAGDKSFTATYGNGVTLNATVTDDYDGVSYVFTWYIGDEKIGEGNEITVSDLPAGNHSVRCEAVATDGVLTSNKSTAVTPIIITKAVLYASFENINIVYGDNLPEIDFSFNGFVYDDDESVVDSTALSFSTSYAKLSPVGEYPVSASGLTADNYEIKGETDQGITAKIIVGKKAVTAKSTLGGSKTYDGSAFTKTYATSDFDGLIAGHVLSLSLSTKSASAGDYADSDVEKTLSIVDENSNDVLQNYAVSFTTAIAIDKADIDYVAPAKLNLAYDGTAHSVIPESLASESGVTYSTALDGTYSTTLSLRNAGDYVVYYKIARANHNEASGSFDVSIAKAKISVTALAQSATYGDTAFALDGTKYQIVGTTYDSLSVKLTTDYAVGDDVGDYSITPALENDTHGAYLNYEVSANDSLLTVTPATLTVAINAITAVYGDAPVFNYTASGLYEADDFADVAYLYIAKGETIVYKSGETFTALAIGGDYAVGASLADGVDNYALSAGESTLTVSKRPITLTIDDKSVTYGDEIPAFTSAYADSAHTPAVTYSCEYTSASETGDYDITATISDGNYDLTVVKGTLTVEKRAITVKANDTQVVYGNALDFSALTYTVARGEFVNGDNPTPTYTTDYTAGDCQNTTLSVSMTNKNYAFTFEDGNITLTARTATITHENTNVAKTENPYSFSITAYVSGAFAGDVFSGTISTKSAEIGTYDSADDFTTSNLKAVNKDGADVSNLYVFDYTLNVVVKEIPIDHTVTNLTHVYDGATHGATVTAAPDVTATYSYNGATTATTPTFVNAGTYTINYTLEEEGKTPYQGSFNFVIKARKVTLTAKNLSATYGSAFTFDETYTVGGDGILPADETANVLAISVAMPAANSNAGSYPLSVTYTENSNYEVTTVNGTLTVNPKSVNVSGGNYTTVYGDRAAAYSGYTIDDENARQFITVLPVGYTATNADALKEYSTTATVTSGNYTVATNTVKMTLTARPITVKAKDLTVTYGDQITLSYEVTSGSVVSGDTLAVSFSSLPSENVGNHTINAIDDGNAKYAVTTQSGVVTIKKATLTVTLNETLQITYGDDFPSFTVSYSGFKKSDGESVIGGTLSVSCPYITKMQAGNLPLTLSGLTADNYDFAYSPATLSVAKAALTLSANPHSAIKYGDDVPAFTYTASGFVAGDTTAILDGKVDFTTNYYKGANVGSYTYNATCATLNDYVVTIGDAQTLTVEKATYSADAVNVALGKLSLTGTYSPTATLASYSLEGTAFTWQDATVIPACDKNSVGYPATYCADTLNYLPYNVNVKINLAKATATISPTESASATWNGIVGTDWTGSVINHTSLIGSNLTHNNTDGGSFAYAITSPASKTNVVDGGVYRVRVSLPETTNYSSASTVVTFKVYSVDFGGTHYTVEDALSLVTSGTITLFGNAFIASNASLASGVTFSITGYDADTGDAKTPTYSEGAKTYVDNDASYIKYKLTVLEGVTVNVNGNLIIRGMMGAKGHSLNSHTSGIHSQIINNGIINLNSGSTVGVRGYIKGEGTLAINSGATMYAPFAIIDYRSGTSTVGSYNNGKIFPFNEYEMPNVQCRQLIYAGSSVIAYADLYADSKHNSTTSIMIATSKALLNLTSGYIEKIYVAGGLENGKTTLNIYGDVTSGSLAMKLRVSILSADVDTAEVFFPINYRYSLNLLSGTAKVVSRFKFLPGSSLYVAPGATLNLDTSNKIDSQLTFYKDSDWSDSVGSLPVRTYPEGKGDAIFTLAGTMNLQKSTRENALSSTYYYSGFGGEIHAENGATVSVASDSVLSITTSEGYGASAGTSVLDKLNAKYYETASITKTALLVNADNSTIPLTTSKTFTYNGTVWS